MRVASIPTIVVEKWMREGFNIMSGEHSAAEIVKRAEAREPPRLPHHREECDGSRQEILQDGHEPENGSQEDRPLWRKRLQHWPRHKAWRQLLRAVCRPDEETSQSRQEPKFTAASIPQKVEVRR